MPPNTSLVFLQYLTTVFDNIQDAIMLIGVEPGHTYRLLMCNDAFATGTGHTKEDEGKLVSDVVVPTAYRSLRLRYDKVVATRKSLEFTEWYDVPLGRQAYEVKIIPILNAVGDCVQMAIISHNITELCELRKEALELRRKLTAAQQETAATKK